jgi:hypothetical protein
MSEDARRKRYKLFDRRYVRHGYIGDPCVYCGRESSGYDHVPSLAHVEHLYDVGLTRGDLRKLPSCRDCNSILGRDGSDDVESRAEVVAKYYGRKFRKFLSVPNWRDKELKAVSGTIRRDIKAHRKAADVIEPLYLRAVAQSLDAQIPEPLEEVQLEMDVVTGPIILADAAARYDGAVVFTMAVDGRNIHVALFDDVSPALYGRGTAVVVTGERLGDTIEAVAARIILRPPQKESGVTNQRPAFFMPN